MFPSLVGSSDSPLKQRLLGPVLQQLDTLLQHPQTPQLIRARDDLWPSALATLVDRTGSTLANSLPAEQLWHGRRERVGDGTGLPLPDTPANQGAYPHPLQHMPGCGFPVLNLVALMSLTTGALVHGRLGTLADHDLPLFQRLWPALPPGNVVGADRAFGSFVTLALLGQRGVDLVVRRHGSRQDQQGRRLGQNDLLVTRQAPPSPAWLAPQEPLPEPLQVREVRFHGTRPGFRTKTIILVTTLLAPTCYPLEALAELCLKRWDMELWLRHSKTPWAWRGFAPQPPHE